MPKDAKKNVDRYKIRGGDLNQFEFTQNQGQVKESLSGTATGGQKSAIGGQKSAIGGQKSATGGKKAATAGQKSATGGKKSPKPVRGATAKKLAAKKAAKNRRNTGSKK